MNLFDGLTVEALIETERRLKSELEDKELPLQRRAEVESCLYHIKEAKKVKRGFYAGENR